MNHSDFAVLKTDEVAACPECDAASIARNGGGNIRTHNYRTYDYRCHNCGELLDEFIVRERQSDARLKGLAKDLAEDDPDEI